jgi:hypothetical protein
MKRTFFVPLIASLFIHLTAVANWSGGTAKIKITPEKPLVMSGYASRTTPFKSIARDIWAKALILEDEKGKRVAIITTDLVNFPFSSYSSQRPSNSPSL